MKKRKVTDQVCLNHTDRQAATRCETCFKPICEDCIVEIDGVAFCSENCAGNYAESKTRLESYELRQAAARRRRRVRRLAVLTILVIVGFILYRWLDVSTDVLDNVQKWLRNLLN